MKTSVVWREGGGGCSAVGVMKGALDRAQGEASLHSTEAMILLAGLRGLY